MANQRIRTLYIISLCMFSFGLFAGCAETESAGTGPGSPTPAVTTFDVTKIVSTGESLSFNAQTGGNHSLALHPTTRLPAVSYYDKSAIVAPGSAAGALKYAYMDSSGTWNIEVVDANYGTAACGVSGSFCVGAPNVPAGTMGNIIDIEFDNNGNPAIAYVYGASVGGTGSKQIRIAERSSAGKWTVGAAASFSTAAAVTNVAIAATSDPISAVTLKFDTSNRPWITYAFYAQTALTNSKTKLSFRSTSGTWSTTDIANNVITAGTITAQAQGTKQAGAVFCPATGNLLLVTSLVDAIAGSGKPVLYRCSSLSDTVGCATWETLVLSNGCAGATTCFSASVLTTANAASRTDLTLTSTNLPLIGLYSTAAPITSLVTAVAPAACNASLASLSTTVSWTTKVVGATNEGQNGFSIAASAANWYVSYLDATTTVVANILATPFTGAWLATGSTLETTTVGSEGVSSALDSTNDVFHTSYAALPAAAAGAVGNDLKIASGPSTDITLSGAQPFNVDVIDNTMSVFPSLAVPMLSSAKSSSGLIGYAYFFQDSTVADSRLYYGVRAGTASSPVFSERLVVSHVEGGATPQFVGAYPSLQYDSNNNPIIAYYNGVTANQSLEVARSYNAGASFQISTVDETSANVGQYPSVAVFGTAIGVAYYDVTSDGLKFARFTPARGWRRYSVDGMAGTGSCGNVADNAGKFASLRFTADGRPVIAYQSNNGLKVAYATEATTSSTYSWTCVALDPSANTRGEGISLALTSTDAPRIAHFDASSGTIRVVTCTSAIGACVTAGQTAFTGVSAGNTGTLSSIVTMPSLQVTTTGKMYLTFYSAVMQGLTLASKSTTDLVWSSEYIDEASAGTSYVSSAGMYGSLLLNNFESPLIFYRSNENWLKYFSREQ